MTAISGMRRDYGMVRTLAMLALPAALAMSDRTHARIEAD
jgi:hypothetical protein